MKLKFKELHRDAKVPEYKSDGASGMDICSIQNVTISPGEIIKIPTGLSVEIPEGYELQVRSRSGLAMSGVCVFNAPGTIDADFRGEIEIILHLASKEAPPSVWNSSSFYIRKGDRIAQLVLQKVERAEIVKVGKLSETKRGGGGFGSTGR